MLRGNPVPTDWSADAARIESEVMRLRAALEPLSSEDHENAPKEPVAGRRDTTDANDEDGIHFGRYGEGPMHKQLRLWAYQNPTKIVPTLGLNAQSETEFRLLSGDRADVAFFDSDNGQAWMVEVKSRISNTDDYIRGIYQCIKYREVYRAQMGREWRSVTAILVTERKLPEDLMILLKKQDIGHVVAPMDR